MSFSFKLTGKVKDVILALQGSNYDASETRAKLLIQTELASYNPEQGVLVEASGHEYQHHTGIKQGNLKLSIENIILCEPQDRSAKMTGQDACNTSSPMMGQSQSMDKPVSPTKTDR